MFYTIEKNDHGLPHDPFKAIIAPRPIGWITSMSASGAINLAPYSYFNGVHSKPPMVMFASETRKDSQTFIEETKEFVCNLATWDLREQMNQTSAPLEHGEDEFPFAGLTAVAGRMVNVPRVGESRAAMECKVIDIVQFRNTEGEKVSAWLVLGEVVAVYIDKSLLKNGVYQTADAYPIMRAGGLNDYVQVSPENVFQIARLEGASSASSHGRG